ncbi:arylamine N-acetyltransferase [Phenylobacterium sp. LH3H17]|uniref:arylamine N-acetyltransferase family protein n=1 Tax=Phenylobacterium sp. LH3H17 TaxID=2903901 RepID=UPI0020C99065|nr:arylamine N-acetyltransferase [Phenylobacterium sp. LH3H17]UTP41027.1 arylamine N-acetyltransferase [Phenylobacterium sp. LH3H17]
MDIQAYFDRVGFSGRARPDLATLTALHRSHLRAIAYENLDVQLGRPMTLDPEAAFDKLVTRRRGGWCYEMNGLLGAVLQEIGFSVTRMAGSVARGERDGRPLGNHLVLRVELDRPYIADVGFGDGILEPFPMTFQDHDCAGYRFRLEDLDGEWLRFHNHANGGAPSFDFTLETASPDQLAATCRWLSTSPDSIFVQTALAFRHRPDGIVSLLGRAHRRIRPDGKETQLLNSAEEFVAVLKRDFDLDVPEAAGLWPTIHAKHEELFGEDAQV